MILLRHCLTRFKGSCRCLEFLIPVCRHLSLEYILSLKLCFPFFFSQANANYFTWSKTGARSSTKTLNGTFQERIACFWNLIIENFMSEKWRVVYSSKFYVGGGTMDLLWLWLWDDVFDNIRLWARDFYRVTSAKSDELSRTVITHRYWYWSFQFFSMLMLLSFKTQWVNSVNVE